MKYASIFLLVGCLAFSFFSEIPVQAKEDTGNPREPLLNQVSGGEKKTDAQIKTERNKLLTFNAYDEFPDIILKAIKAQFKKQKGTLHYLEKQPDQYNWRHCWHQKIPLLLHRPMHNLGPEG